MATNRAIRFSLHPTTERATNNAGRKLQTIPFGQKFQVNCFQLTTVFTKTAIKKTAISQTFANWKMPMTKFKISKRLVIAKKTKAPAAKELDDSLTLVYIVSVV